MKDVVGERGWGRPGPALLIGVILALGVTPAVGEIAEPNWQHLCSKNGDFPQPTGSLYQTTTLILDIDRDGVNDFVVASRETNGKVEWWRRSSGGWTRYLIDNVPYIEAGGDFADIDGDGDLDIVLGQDDHGTIIFWWENPYPNYQPDTAWPRHIIRQGGEKLIHDLVLGDFDGDGRLELVYWNQYGPGLFLAEIPANPRTAETWTSVLIFATTVYSEGLDAADIDGDGVVDIVGAGYWFKYNGPGNFTPNLIVDYPNSRIRAGQLKAAGRPEVVISSGDTIGQLAWYEWNGATWTEHILESVFDHGHSLELADINGDGHLDIFAAEMRLHSGNPDAKTCVYYGDGLGNFTRQSVAVGIDHHESRVGDLDGDGDIDILGKPFEWDTPRLDIWLNSHSGPPPPSDRPTAPANLRSLSTTANAHLLAWDPSSDQIGVAGYRLYRNGAQIAQLNQTCCNDPNLPAQTTFTYTVRAYNSLQKMSDPRVPLALATEPVTPATWLSRDLFQENASFWGRLGKPGLAWADPNGTLRVAGGGYDIGGLADAGHYVYQPLEGNGMIAARLLDFTGPTGYYNYPKAGLMLRENTGPEARMVFLYITAGNYVGMMARTTAGYFITNLASVGGGLPLWMQLSRVGNTFTGRFSCDSQTWFTLGSINLALAPRTLAGIAVTSQNCSTLCTAAFMPVIWPGLSDPNAPLPPRWLRTLELEPNKIEFGWNAAAADDTILGYRIYRDGQFLNVSRTASFGDLPPAAGSVFSYQVQAYDLGGNSSPLSKPLLVDRSLLLPAAWQGNDLGPVGSSGSGGYDPLNNRFTMYGAGHPLGGTSDEFFYLNRSQTGDFDLIAQVAQLTPLADSPLAAAGLMLRASLDPNAPLALVAIRPGGNGVRFYLRATPGAIPLILGSNTQTPPAWLRLSRSGGLIRGYYSADGITWQLLHTAIPSALLGPARLGLALNGGDDTPAQAIFTNVTLAANPDLNWDAAVNLADLTTLAHNWLLDAPGLPGDLNLDRQVNVLDLGLFTRQW